MCDARSTPSAEPLDPFGDGLPCRVELIGRVGLAQPALDDTPHHRLSVGVRRLLDFHLVSLGTLKLRNLSLLGSDQMDNLWKDHT
ncbi:hypothetical protein FXB40_28445 [Bradyrhizobium rifense]|uniref:Uncharacterized protein n=1 Tax=Bradyrhizobium rifense TaxID=515499 RepID=A0A5D3K6N0_9BRAD|nr:hypothetical protein FXB40_28445 [Bradyrhizobium rifense]